MSPGKIVNAYLAAQTAGDAAGALQLLADDAVLEAAPPDVCASPNPCVGKRDIETYFIRRVLSGHPNLTPVEQIVDGDVVRTRVEVRNDGVRMAGFDRYAVITTAGISGGKIRSFSVVRDLDDSETAAFNDWQLAHR
jgi:ketosteroid isomerase-like protein